MSVLTPKRVLLTAVALLIGTTAFAAHPSARSYARMAFDPAAAHTVLFGGESSTDPGTAVNYDIDETWFFTGNRWIQAFPVTTPAGRAAQAMVYDSARARIVMFGGRRARTVSDGEPTLLNDTWVWKNDNWTQIATPNAPEGRHHFSMTYDSVRDRVILFGGARRNAANTAFENAFDTWEFDGTSWTKIAVATEPPVVFPLLSYDAARNQVILLGREAGVTKMYVYDSANRAWVAKTPEKLPPCVNDGILTYRSFTREVIYAGGVCTIDTPQLDSTWSWDGTNWRELTVSNLTRITAAAVAYDSLRDTIVTYGGFAYLESIPRAFTLLFRGRQGWSAVFTETRPTPRSLSAFRTDPVNNTVWLFGGLNETSENFMDELWGYRDGQWFPRIAANGPVACASPLAAYDANRSKLVVTCFGSEVFEWDGKEWKTFDPKNDPAGRRLAGLVYDETLQRVVLFGGYDGANHRNDTWLWDGTNWTELKKNKPTARGLMSMWFDPIMRKTVIYGGLGRKDIDERVTRYSDMWALDANGWTKLNPSLTPGERFGAQFAVDPRTNKLILFGGLRSVFVDEEEERRRQFFDNDTWQWDGGAQSWTKLAPARSPRARQNGMMAWDPIAKQLVLYGGYAGFYFSDMWIWTGTTWEPRIEPATRRRPVAPGVAPVAPPTTFVAPTID